MKKSKDSNFRELLQTLFTPFPLVRAQHLENAPEIKDPTSLIPSPKLSTEGQQRHARTNCTIANATLERANLTLGRVSPQERPNIWSEAPMALWKRMAQA